MSSDDTTESLDEAVDLVFSASQLQAKLASANEQLAEVKQERDEARLKLRAWQIIEEWLEYSDEGSRTMEIDNDQFILYEWIPEAAGTFCHKIAEGLSVFSVADQLQPDWEAKYKNKTLW